MSQFHISLSAFCLCLMALMSSCNESVPNDFKEKGTYQLSIKKGNIVTFSLPQNKSTGYELCWMNESKLVRQFKLEGIKSMLKDPNNVDGGGETVTYQVLATETGKDTLKFNQCPTRLWQKDCEFFEVDSLRVMGNGVITSTYAPHMAADYQVVITVTE
ncbi:MAG: protease inhibitor I42 family protein [Taibaiella sp.]|nr:protease inhibitor I42 family protein [Taibaiella sp.]